MRPPPPAARALANVVDVGVETTAAVGLLAVNALRARPTASRSASAATRARSDRPAPPTALRS